MKLLFLPGSYTFSPSRFRVLQFVQPLEKLGHDITVRVIYPDRLWGSSIGFPLVRKVHHRLCTAIRIISTYAILRDAEKFDVIFMNRDIIPEIKIQFIEPWLARRNPHLIFDFDDSIHVGNRETKLRKILPNFAWLTPGNAYLAAFAHTVHSRVTILPTVINTEIYCLASERKPGPLRVGWSGSRLSFPSLYKIEPVIAELARRLSFEFVIIAEVRPNMNWPGVNWRYIPWTPETEVSGLQELDIGIMPLEDSPSERGKCGLKAIQYGGVGIPAVVSPVGVNRDIVIHGETGFHCSSKEEWIFNLNILLKDNQLRDRMGITGRKHIEKYYSIKSLLPKMINLFENVASL